MRDIDDKGGVLKKPVTALFSGVQAFQREAEIMAKSKIFRLTFWKCPSRGGEMDVFAIFARR